MLSFYLFLYDFLFLQLNVQDIAFDKAMLPYKIENDAPFPFGKVNIYCILIFKTLRFEEKKTQSKVSQYLGSTEQLKHFNIFNAYDFFDKIYMHK